MAAIIAATLFALLMLAISFYGYRSYARPARLMERLGVQTFAEVIRLGGLASLR